ncbi:MAG TPA: adenylate/guanylate cyclase domain-containing protein [Nitrososphaeraceae archaeon]|nr:adenylate/guanylate cyclase domain-containing protein [Nitrososphaeraceae archaeon]
MLNRDIMDFPTFALQEQIRARVTKTLKNGIQLNMSTEESKKFLRRHVNARTNLVIMIVDINNSTQMSLTLPEFKFAQLLQTFAQEVSIVVSGYGGFVFKYEGDAVIVIFPADYDEIKACKNALNCSSAVLEIVKNGINPIFRENELPEITLRTGLAFGPTLVVLYGKNLEKAHVDITGSSVSLAAKIASIAKPNQVLVGELVYNIIMSSKDKSFLNEIKFEEVRLDPIKWKYLSQSDPQSLYHVYEYLIN